MIIEKKIGIGFNDAEKTKYFFVKIFNVLEDILNANSGKYLGRDNLYNKNILKRTADGYYLTGLSLMNTRKNSVNFFAYYISPCAVNLSFACELYFKSLYLEEKNKNYDRGHALIPLYQRLSDGLKSLINEEYCKTKTIETLDKCLATHDNAFKNWRYFFENKQVSFEPNSLFALATSLKTICERYEKQTIEGAADV